MQAAVSDTVVGLTTTGWTRAGWASVATIICMSRAPALLNPPRRPVGQRADWFPQTVAGAMPAHSRRPSAVPLSAGFWIYNNLPVDTRRTPQDRGRLCGKDGDAALSSKKCCTIYARSALGQSIGARPEARCTAEGRFRSVTLCSGSRPPDPSQAFSQPSHCDAANQFLVSVQSTGIVAKP